MGGARKTGRKASGFIDSVLGLITDFYEMVVQDLTPWTPTAPKVTKRLPAVEAGATLEASAPPPVVGHPGPAETAQPDSPTIVGPDAPPAGFESVREDASA
jgi:hypothetical protein